MSDAAPTLGVATRVWARIGWLSFGGPAGQIALMHDELVVRRRWIDEPRFLHALNYCMLLPGPEAQQLATYVGWLMHRTRGALIAGTLFVLPGLLVVTALAAAYCSWHDVGAVRAIVSGLQLGVVALVASAVVRIGKRALRGPLPVALAVASLGAIAIARVPFPAIVAAAAAIGVIAHRLAPRSLPLPAPSSEPRPPVAVPLARTIRVALVCAAAWWLPVAAVALAAPDSLYLEQALVFSKAAVITFGGAYAALAYVGQRAIAAAWVTPGQLVDALGLAETTPGPLVLVLPFVGFVAAYPVDGLGGGVAAALLAAWVTFAPSFLWILVGAPYVEWLRGNRPLAAALAAITAAVVGVITNLSLWFAMHTLFAAHRDVAVGPWTVTAPVAASIDGWNAAAVVAAVVAVVVGKVKTPWLLAGCAGFGVARLLLGP